MIQLDGREEHYLKRELLLRQVQYEIAELSKPTALRRFGRPFRSDNDGFAAGGTNLPILRYMFVHYVQTFPFLDETKDKDEFWQNKVQVFLESFANKRMSTSEDRNEETKRRKLAQRLEKLIESTMNAGLRTASGREEPLRKENLVENVTRDPDHKSLLVNVPEGNVINGLDINVCSVRQIRQFLIRTKRSGQQDIVVARRYGEFLRLHRQLQNEFPGKRLPRVPAKNKKDALASTEPTFPFNLHSDNSIDSTSTSSSCPEPDDVSASPRRTTARRENQRLSLRAYLRRLVADPRIAQAKPMVHFLTSDPTEMTVEDKNDEEQRKSMDNKRVEEQVQFFEIARQRARELNEQMSVFGKELVESNGLVTLFNEIRNANKISELPVRYQKFAEWARIEAAATIYHLFVAEDNSPEVFSQAKRIHGLIPYTLLRNLLRFSNPVAMMRGTLDLFLAQPFGQRSLLQRIMSMTLSDDIKSLQTAIDALKQRIDDPALCDKIRAYLCMDSELQEQIQEDAEIDQIDLVVAILRSEIITPPLNAQQITKVFNAYVAWTSAVESGTSDNTILLDAKFFSSLVQLLKLLRRQRDKTQMIELVFEGVTPQLFRELFTVFYEPLARVYKAANVYTSVTDFSNFVDDLIQVVENVESDAGQQDPNQLVQSFIDLCARHEDKFYAFVHEVHIHDDGLFDRLMVWIDRILDFMRQGPRERIDMDALFDSLPNLNEKLAKQELGKLMKYNVDRKVWRESKAREKMAASTTGWQDAQPNVGFSISDIGLQDEDIAELQALEDDDSGDEDTLDLDPLQEAIQSRSREKRRLRRRAGEPKRPRLKELSRLQPLFTDRLKQILAC